MKTAVYQYWDGPQCSGNDAGSFAMKQYANKIGADYFYDDNPGFVTDLGKYSPHYGAFKPLFDNRFDDYDYILFVDTDVWPVEHTTENIFDQFVGTDVEVGICEEADQPLVRLTVDVGGINGANDKRWLQMIESTFQVKLPVTEQGLPRVYNSGVVVYSKAGRLKAQQKFVQFGKYVSMVQAIGLPPFYTCDQPYLHAMLEVCKFNWITMDSKWNSSVHYVPKTGGNPRPVVDLRTPETNFVHVQLNGKHHFSASKLWDITNLPVDQWKL
jgi:hypothetical protein